MSPASRIILIDADVVSHFITGGAIPYLSRIFPNEIRVLDKVYAELQRFPGKKREVDNLIHSGQMQLMPFPDEKVDMRNEYLHIKKLMFKGDGEAACMAVVRYSKDILASSNLKDIASYCKMHSIDYLTTMDFLCEAIKRGILEEAECDEFIRKVKAAKSKLPVNSMKEFKCREIRLDEL
jgi:hypothetical protein